MAQFEAFEDGVEVNGQTVLAFVNGTPEAFQQRALRILEENGIEDPEEGEWYLQQAWLDAFAEIADKVGEHTLHKIGRSIPQNADWPSGIDTVVEGLESINEAYHMNHRNGEIGYYRAEVVEDEENTVRVYCKNPYPCPFDRGIIAETTAEFTETSFTSVEEVGEECRSEGGDECVYEVSWS